MTKNNVANDVQIRYITTKVISDSMQRDIKRAGVTLADPQGAQWFGAFVNDELVGVACAVLNRKTGATRFKSDFVASEHRGKGVYAALFKARMAWAAMNGAKSITAFCGPMSINTYKRHGFLPVKRIGTTENIFVQRGA